MSCSALYLGSCNSLTLCLANFFASLAPIHRSPSLSSSGGAFFLSFSLFAELPALYFDQGLGICALCTLLAYCTSTRLVSMNVPLKYFNASVAISSVLNPTNAICLDVPSAVRTIFTSVTSPITAKCSRSRPSFRCFGTFFTHSRLDGVAASSPSPSSPPPSARASRTFIDGPASRERPRRSTSRRANRARARLAAASSDGARSPIGRSVGRRGGRSVGRRGGRSVGRRGGRFCPCA